MALGGRALAYVNVTHSEGQETHRVPEITAGVRLLGSSNSGATWPCELSRAAFQLL